MEDNNTATKLHPIAEAAARQWSAKRELDAAFVSDMALELEPLRRLPELGWAVRSLVKLAGYIDQNHGDRRSADRLLLLVCELHPDIESQNKRAKQAEEQRQRNKRAAFHNFLSGGRR
jgi:hypothetical protein